MQQQTSDKSMENRPFYLKDCGQVVAVDIKGKMVFFDTLTNLQTMLKHSLWTNPGDIAQWLIIQLRPLTVL